MTTTSEPTGIFSPEGLVDPYPYFSRLRERSPIWDSQSETWCLLRFPDVYGVLRDHATFSSSSYGEDSNDPIRLVLITDDPPRHTRFRALVNKVFTPRRIAELEPWLTAVANELLDEMGTGDVDVVRNYTVPLPVRTIARLLGIPGEDYQTFKRWTDSFLFFNPEGEALDGVKQDLMDMVGYFGKMIAARKEHGAADLITALVNAEVEGEHLQDWEILGFSVLLLVAGNETTTNLMGNMLNILADRPDIWERVRDDRSLVEAVVDETLRYESPVRVLWRRATHDTEINGVTIPANAQLGVFYGAANRDPAEFADADEFRLDRELQTHLAFGIGVHFCLGSALARTEARITLNAFLDRYQHPQRGAEPPRRQTTSPIVFGFQNLPLVLRPR